MNDKTCDDSCDVDKTERVARHGVTSSYASVRGRCDRTRLDVHKSTTRRTRASLSSTTCRPGWCGPSPHARANAQSSALPSLVSLRLVRPHVRQPRDARPHCHLPRSLPPHRAGNSDFCLRFSAAGAAKHRHFDRSHYVRFCLSV
mgnify:CR=1 FL=1